MMRPAAAGRAHLLAILLGWVCASAALAQVANAASPAPGCHANPLNNRTLHLRGSFNGWAAADAQRFAWICNRFELVTRLAGEHRFKLGDEAWSADADFGAARGAEVVANPAAPSTATLALALRGADIARPFQGTYRFIMTPADTSSTATATTPAPPATLRISECPAGPPLGPITLYLRGTMNNWAALDGNAFQWRCDAYWLNVNFTGLHSFKIGDSAWARSTTFGAAPGGRSTPAIDHALGLQRMSDPGVAGDLGFIFGGEQTLKLQLVDGEPRLTIGPRSFDDGSAVAITDPVALSLRFDSRASAHRTPFGAVPAGTTVNFAVDAAPGVDRLTLVIERRELHGNQERLDYLPLARVPMTREAGGGTTGAAARAAAVVAGSATATTATAPDRWRASHAFGALGIYGHWFEAEIAGKTFVYQNNADSVPWTREKGSGGVGAVAEKPGLATSLRRWRISVHDPAFAPPAWGADAVYYYIFPDRFRNGDKRNDPQPGTRRYQNHDIEYHANWMDAPWKPRSGDGSDSVYNNDFFGGDLAGIIDKLGDIADLGANVIYMTPIFQAASNHKYDHADYHQIDASFGSNADFTRLTQAAAQHGIRVVIDASLNHVGSDSVYFDRFGNYAQTEKPSGSGVSQNLGAFSGGRIRPESPYAGWFSLDATQSETDKQYKGWVGVADLPELDKASPAWRDFAYRANDSVTRTWLQRGASGWRMDVAPWVPDDFWREWRAAVKHTQPEAITIAETWFDASKHLLGDMFDSTMNYIFRNSVLDYVLGGSAKALATNLELLRENYPPQAHSALMNLISGHDSARALHLLGYHGSSTSADEIARAKQRLKLAVFMQMVYPGAPAVYYGDEVGMTGGDDPYNRGPSPWADQGGKPDLALRAEFKRLIRLRKDHPVLRHGSLQAPLLADEHVLVLLRRQGPEWAVTALNNSAAERTVTVQLPPGAPAEFSDGLTRAISRSAGGRLTLTLPPLFGSALFGR